MSVGVEATNLHNCNEVEKKDENIKFINVRNVFAFSNANDYCTRKF